MGNHKKINIRFDLTLAKLGDRPSTEAIPESTCFPPHCALHRKGSEGLK